MHPLSVQNLQSLIFMEVKAICGIALMLFVYNYKQGQETAIIDKLVPLGVCTCVHACALS